MHPIKVFILASQSLFAQGVQSLLVGRPGIEVIEVATCVGGSDTGFSADTLARVRKAAPDVVIVEARGEQQSHLVARVLESVPGARVVALTLEDNLIHVYYQQMKQGRRVEDLLEVIRSQPVEWRGRGPEALRLFVLFQGQYGQRILDNIRRFAPETWTVNAWRAPLDLPLVVDEPSAFLPVHFPISDLLLSLGESGSAAQLIPGAVERMGVQAVIAPVDNVDWLPEGLVRQLQVQLEENGVTAVFPKPFCSLTEESYGVRQHVVAFDDPWIEEFARYFGRPGLRIECDGRKIASVEVERDTACGCARSVARQLVGEDVGEAVARAGLLHHHYPCRATMRVDPALREPLIQVAGDFMRRAVEVEIAQYLSSTTQAVPQNHGGIV
ncbi:MAG: hypothetical protein DRI48_00640 [Chloroflexi bacterium]|nr:MAG: hypothetical protein DRI48_00640 [Chloroflexota bacterium]